jgi:hypothetical protein
MRFSRSFPIVAAAAVAMGLFAAGPASADTGTSVVLGPVPLPSVPAQVCVSQTAIATPSGLIPGLLGGLGLTGAPATTPVTKCYSTPGAGSVSMTIDVKALTPTVAVTPPTVTRVPCPAGTSGIAGRINSGSADVKAAGTVTVTLPGGRVTQVPVGTGTIPAGKSLTLYGCSGLS